MSKRDFFVITRADGRSNTQVILDLVRPVEPGHTFTFDALSDALSEGTNRRYERDDVRKIVGTAFNKLSSELRRALHPIRNVGYRVSPADGHRELALIRKDRADLQMKRGLMTLRNVRWEEMGAEERKAHEGTLMLVGALYEQQRAMERRQSNIEDAIRNMMKREEDTK